VELLLAMPQQTEPLAAVRPIAESVRLSSFDLN